MGAAQSRLKPWRSSDLGGLQGCLAGTPAAFSTTTARCSPSSRGHGGTPSPPLSARARPNRTEDELAHANASPISIAEGGRIEFVHGPQQLRAARLGEAQAAVRSASMGSPANSIRRSKCVEWKNG